MKQSQRWWVLVVVSLALFMSSLDNLAVITALPAIQHALHASVSDLEWTVNAYTLVFTILMIPAAALGERFGRRRILLLGVFLFTLGSATSALAMTPLFLTLSRALQGLGAACITPLTLTMIARAFPEEQRGMAIGLWSGISGIGMTIGPLVGGAIVSGWSWNMLFWVNVPIGLLLLVLGQLRLRESYGEQRPIDLPGGLLVMLALLSIVYALNNGNAVSKEYMQMIVWLLLGLVILCLFFIRERLTAAPMIDLSLFGIRGFSTANTISLLSSFGMFGSIFFITQFLQNVQQLSPLAAGLETIPWTVTMMITATAAGLLLTQVGTRLIVLIGMLAQAIALIWIGVTAGAQEPYLQLLPAFILAGAGMGMTLSPLSTAVIASVQEIYHGQASSISYTVRELGGVFGVAVLGAIFQQVVLTPGQFLDGFRLAVFVGAGVLLVGAALAFWLTPAKQ